MLCLRVCTLHSAFSPLSDFDGALSYSTDQTAFGFAAMDDVQRIRTREQSTWKVKGFFGDWTRLGALQDDAAGCACVKVREGVKGGSPLSAGRRPGPGPGPGPDGWRLLVCVGVICGPFPAPQVLTSPPSFLSSQNPGQPSPLSPFFKGSS
jgi:hypothetical protein